MSRSGRTGSSFGTLSWSSGTSTGWLLMSSQPVEVPEDQLRVPKELPILPLRDIVVYPFIIVPLSVSRERSIRAIDQALADNRMILLVSQKDSKVEEPSERDLFNVGTVGVIMRMLKLPDGRIRVLVQGVCRAKVDEFTRGEQYTTAHLTRIVEPQVKPTMEQEAMMRTVKKSLEKSASLGKAISSEVMVIASSLEDPGRLADLVASNLDLKIEDAQAVLKMVDPVARLKKVNDLLNKELELLNMQQEINTHAREEIDKSQGEYFLRQQLKAIQNELGEGNDLAEEVEQFRDKCARRRCPRRSSRRSSARSTSWSACTPTRPRPPRCATTSTG